MAGFPKIKPGRRLQWEERQQAHVLLYPEGMVTLSESAADILKLCDGTLCVKDIAAHFAAEFAPDVESCEVEHDVLSFLQEAATYGWIRISAPG